MPGTSKNLSSYLTRTSSFIRDILRFKTIVGLSFVCLFFRLNCHIFFIEGAFFLFSFTPAIRDCTNFDFVFFLFYLAITQC